jgi:hypothetical protein
MGGTPGRRPFPCVPEAPTIADMRLAVVAILLLALGPNAAPPAEAQGCRTDRLGNTLCRDLPRQSPPLVRPGRSRTALTEPAPETAPEDVTMSGGQQDAFGETRPPRLSVSGGRPFGAPPRPVPPTRICVRDNLGTVRCR